jgi:acetylglutamate kinase
MADTHPIAATLMEALPYIQRFAGKTVVVKYGGNAMVDEDLKEAFARDIILLCHVGLYPVVVHGGGPQIGVMLDALGLETQFVEGHRVTDDATMDVVEMVLVGQVNQRIVSLINHHGGKAVGLSGKDGRLLRAERLTIERPASGAGRPPEIIDPGRVGRVTKVNPEPIVALEAAGFVPVIAPVGVTDSNETLNINADLVAGEVAAALSAEKLILMTDVLGLLDSDGELISRLDPGRVDELRAEGTVVGGMIPKLEAGQLALAGGVAGVHIIDGRVPHAILLELFTDSGIGTMLEPTPKG